LPTEFQYLSAVLLYFPTARSFQNADEMAYQDSQIAIAFDFSVDHVESFNCRPFTHGFRPETSPIGARNAISWS
jgi:hypothetical protein